MGHYLPAIWEHSIIHHDKRPDTLGVVIHETYGHPAGDIPILEGHNSSDRVDIHYYITHKGQVYQMVDDALVCWAAMYTANHHCVQIEHEGTNETGWTREQIIASARLVAYLCHEYKIPVVHAKPVSGSLYSLKGIMSHKDLTDAKIDGNTHTDGLPSNQSWETYLHYVTQAYNGHL
jgi:hypothetical protein